MSALHAGAATVTTLAGSGRAGFSDARGSAASFVMPQGIAAAPDGSLIVADTGAQRIRRVDAFGRVTTVAGSGELDASRLWVRGGYRDGAAARARFNEPTAVSVAPDGSIVVADSGNHCLRRIFDGTVTTYAGVPGTAGHADGDLRAATFWKPMSLAYDSDGTLYVADYGTGVRIVTPAGKVSTLTPTLLLGVPSTVTGVAVLRTSGKTTLYAALQQGIAMVDLAGGTSYLFPSPWADVPEHTIFLEGFRTIGWPFEIAAEGPLRLVYTDPLSNTVRYVAENFAAQVAGLPVENEAYSEGKFRDGQGYDVRFRQPVGVTKWTGGRFAIADTGNRRIRIISGIDFRHQTDPGDLQQSAAFYRILYVGTSYASYNQAWNDSIAGIVEAGLRPRWKELGLPREPRVFPMQNLASLQANADLIRLYVNSNLAEAVIWQINSGQIDLLLGTQPAFDIAANPAQWKERATAIIASVRDAARARGVPLLISINPMPFEVSPVEDANQRLIYAIPERPVADYAQVGPLLAAAAADAGVPVVDVFPEFRQNELSVSHPALFGAIDWHFSSAGASLVGNDILKALVEGRPWARAGN